MSARDINDLQIPYQRYLLSTNDLPQGYLFVLRIPAVYQWPSPGISHAAFGLGSLAAKCSRHWILLLEFSTAQQTVHQAQPDLLFPFLSFGARARARARRRRRGLAVRSGRGESTWAVLHRRRWVQEGPGCDAELKPPRLYLATRSLDVPDVFEVLVIRQHRLQLLEEIRMYGVLIVGFSFM